MTTVRALKSHGGVAFDKLGEPDLDAVKLGSENLAAHIDIVKAYGLPCVVAINRFPTDTQDEIDLVRELAGEAGAQKVVVNDGFSQGGEGAVELAEAVVEACEQPNSFDQLTPDGTPIKQQIAAIATRLYGAEGCPTCRRPRRTSRAWSRWAWAPRRCAWPRRTCRCRTTRCC